MLLNVKACSLFLIPVCHFVSMHAQAGQSTVVFFNCHLKYQLLSSIHSTETYTHLTVRALVLWMSYQKRSTDMLSADFFPICISAGNLAVHENQKLFSNLKSVAEDVKPFKLNGGLYAVAIRNTG